jgi:acyl CoA:acetate/3-ketoacid CoA transferase beta subunit
MAAECVVVATLSPTRTPLECGYVTSPGRAVRALVTDLGVLEKSDAGELVLTTVPEGPEPIAERVERARTACGWDLEVVGTVAELALPSADEVGALRRWDPRGWFLRAR